MKTFFNDSSILGCEEGLFLEQFLNIVRWSIMFSCYDFNDNRFLVYGYGMGTFYYTNVYRVKVKFDGFDQCTYIQE